MPEFIRGLHNIKSRHHGNVVTIGAFDGLHRGHQAIIRQLRQESERLQLPSMVVIFEPQPNEFFIPEQAPARLMRLGEKVSGLQALGVDRVLCLSFNRSLRQLSADQFIEQVLEQAIGTQFLVVGDDFRFGCNREGDYKRLQQAAFPVVDTPSVLIDGQRISSTWVREALGRADFEQAEVLLGRPYSISGKVIPGQQIGQTIGIPTANIRLHRCQTPLSGVFAVTVEVAGKAYPAVANVGFRPTVANDKEPLLEVHLFDFDGSLYGQRLTTCFYQQLRQEQRFDSLGALTSQIQLDIQRAKEFFNDHDRL